jgi:hypothetical protein
LTNFPRCLHRVATAPLTLEVRNRRAIILGLSLQIQKAIEPLDLADKTRVLLALRAGLVDLLEQFENEV